MRRKKQADAGTVNERPSRRRGRAAAADEAVLPSPTVNVFADADLAGAPSSQAREDSAPLLRRKPLHPTTSNVPPSVSPQVPEFRATSVDKMSSDYEARLLTVQQVCDAIDAEVESRSAALRAITAAQYLSFKAQMDLQLSKFSGEEQNMPLKECLRSCPGIQSIVSDNGKVQLLKGASSSYPKLEDSKRNLHDTLMKAKESTSKKISSVLFTPYAGPRISVSQLHTSENEEQGGEQNPLGEELSWPEYYLRLQSQGYKSGLTPALGSHSKINTPMGFKHGFCGITPKTARLPKDGETVLSINGSPLGQFGKTPGNASGTRIKRTQRRLASFKRSLCDL